jgi:hypothetical protein
MKRLLVRYERRADLHEAFLALGCCLICFRRLNQLIQKWGLRLLSGCRCFIGCRPPSFSTTAY